MRIAEAAQFVRRRIDPALGERWRQRPAAREEMPQGGDGVGDIDRFAVVGVGGIEAGGCGALGEKVAQGEDGVGDVDGVTGVGVAAEEGMAGCQVAS